jgi:hypothetical protein
MSWFSKIIGAITGGAVKEIGDVVDKFHTSTEEKELLKMEMEKILQARDSEIEQTIRQELQSKERVIVAEMRQSDNYTKRARPTVVYFGLVMIFVNYVLVPTISMLSLGQPQAFDLPTEFWAAWGGIVATWSIGRSAEKRGTRNKATDLITGNNGVSLLD